MNDGSPMADSAVMAAWRDDDPTLMRRMATGDHTAFELLMRRHNRRLFRLARATLRNEAEAEDALQEAYIAAYRSCRQFRGDAAPASWLYRLVLNECLSRIRRQTRRDRVAPMQRTQDTVELDTMAANRDRSPENMLIRAEMRHMLERELDAMPAIFRQVFVLRCVEEMTVEETACCLGIAEATVRSRLFRARGMLRLAMARNIDMAQHDVYEFGGAHCDRLVGQVLLRLQERDPTQP